LRGRCSLTPGPPTRGREKGGKGTDAYKMNIKTVLLIISSEIKYTKLILSINGYLKNSCPGGVIKN